MKRSALLCVALITGMMTQNLFAQQGRNQVPETLEGGRTEIYKTVDDVQLKIFIFEPEGHKASDNKPAVVFFFGGGWRSGTPKQFHNHCRYLASRGMVAMTAEYRVYNRHQVRAVKCVNDAKSAIRWARTNAKRLGIDPNRLAAGGGSAGGHLAACTGTIEGYEEKGEDTSISSRPNAMLLFNPAVDLSPEGFNNKPGDEGSRDRAERSGTDPINISPVHHVSKGVPPTIIFHGKADPTVPFAQAEKFGRLMKEQGNRCEVDGHEGEVHGFFNWGRNGNKAFIATVTNADKFLVSLGYLKGEPQVEKFVKSVE